MSKIIQSWLCVLNERGVCRYVKIFANIYTFWGITFLVRRAFDFLTGREEHAKDYADIFLFICPMAAGFAVLFTIIFDALHDAYQRITRKQ